MRKLLVEHDRAESPHGHGHIAFIREDHALLNRFSRTVRDHDVGGTDCERDVFNDVQHDTAPFAFDVEIRVVGAGRRAGIERERDRTGRDCPAAR